MAVAATIFALWNALIGCGSSRPSATDLFGQPLPGKLSPLNYWGLPASQFAGRPPKGWVLLVHGGGWEGVGRSSMFAPSVAQRFEARGWGTYTIDYRAGEASFWDVLYAYDYLRQRVGHVPICSYGSSAGGHLVMLLAAVRPLSCVISEGGITDLRSLGTQAIPAPGGQLEDAFPRGLQAIAERPSVFGRQLWRWSPIRVASLIRAPMLLGGSSFDGVVPEAQQMAEITAVRPQTQVMLLQGSRKPVNNFTHAAVTAQAAVAWQNAISQILNQALR